jgi:5-enolpyruvylshikimate-3-phosphate synthase
MSLAVAALRACGKTEIKGFDCVDISFPGFYDVMMKVLNVANSGSL